MTFDGWKAGFLTQAEHAGISQETLHQIAPHLTHLEAPAKADSNQAEVRKTLRQYLELVVSDTRISNGGAAMAQHVETFAQIEDRFHVDPFIVAAIWGMETNYGTVRGDIPVFAALASLAFQGRRRALFEDQLIAACQIIEQGTIAPEAMIGSWAGAMGHTQFMPTSYRDYAVGFSQGAADIWSDDPKDALASAAHYLSCHGWDNTQPWAIEVSWPKGMDLYHARHADPQGISDWTAQDVVPMDTCTAHGDYKFHLPAGTGGPAFLVGCNYQALLRYNNADAYAVGVGHLADRLRGGSPFKTPWAVDPRGLTKEEVAQCQALLTKAGFDTFGADGFSGPNTIKAVESFQMAHGFDVDGFLDLELLQTLQQ